MKCLATSHFVSPQAAEQQVPSVYLHDLPCLDDSREDAFPPSTQALQFPSGLLAWGGTLAPGRLLAAYRRGIFPWYSEGEPVLWWTPSPRCVLYPRDVYISSRTQRRLRRGEFRVSADSAFADVIQACAAARPERPSTWITSDMQSAYLALHDLGVAHSIEAWRDGELVGGVYGLSIGHMFFGESMFSLITDASKVALISLCRQLEEWGFGPVDCQVANPHLESLGAVEIGREEFEAALRDFTLRPRPDGSWRDTFGAGRNETR